MPAVLTSGSFEWSLERTFFWSIPVWTTDSFEMFHFMPLLRCKCAFSAIEYKTPWVSQAANDLQLLPRPVWCSHKVRDLQTQKNETGKREQEYFGLNKVHSWKPPALALQRKVSSSHFSLSQQWTCHLMKLTEKGRISVFLAHHVNSGMNIAAGGRKQTHGPMRRKCVQVIAQSGATGSRSLHTNNQEATASTELKNANPKFVWELFPTLTGYLGMPGKMGPRELVCLLLHCTRVVLVAFQVVFSVTQFNAVG